MVLPRTILFSKAFNEFYSQLPPRLREKYNYVLEILRTQQVVSTKFVKKLEGSVLYELRLSVNTNEYRTIMFAVDDENLLKSKTILLLNSFLKKDTKQYRHEISQAERILSEYIED